MPEDRNEIAQRLAEDLNGLTDTQLRWIDEIVRQLRRAHNYERNQNSDVVSDCVLNEIGDAIRLHHCFSKQAFTKDKFEYLMERAINLCGGNAQLARAGNPGHDITINGQRFSLKTQADQNIRRSHIHISKFMELGQGQWTDQPADLIGLRARFFSHMNGYERILVLRTLSRDPNPWEYELVEIPKDLLLLAANGELEMKMESRQMPKPGYCHVRDNNGNLLFQLYFDGGTERKLQIKAIDIRRCVIHAAWSFPSEELITEA